LSNQAERWASKANTEPLSANVIGTTGLTAVNKARTIASAVSATAITADQTTSRNLINQLGIIFLLSLEEEPLPAEVAEDSSCFSL
jgi:hypothetical protein